MKKEASAGGIWKAIVTPEAGQVDDLATVINVPADSVKKVKNDQDKTIMIKEKDPMIHILDLFNRVCRKVNDSSKTINWSSFWGEDSFSDPNG